MKDCVVNSSRFPESHSWAFEKKDFNLQLCYVLKCFMDESTEDCVTLSYVSTEKFKAFSRLELNVQLIILKKNILH